MPNTHTQKDSQQAIFTLFQLSVTDGKLNQKNLLTKRTKNSVHPTQEAQLSSRDCAKTFHPCITLCYAWKSHNKKSWDIAIWLQRFPFGLQ